MKNSEKYYQCPYCEETFPTRTLLRSHKATHPSAEKERIQREGNFTPFPRRCHVCDRLVSKRNVYDHRDRSIFSYLGEER